MSFFRHRVFFTLLLVMFALGILAMTPRLGKVARLVPLWVVVPTLAILVLQLALDLSCGFRRRCQGLEQHGWLRFGRGSPEMDQEKKQRSSPQGRSVAQLGWALLLPVMIYLLGFFVAIPIHAFVCLKRLSGEGWRLSLAIPASLGALLVLIARVIPSIPLWEGWVWIQLGIR